MKQIEVGILGATGMVGQHFIKFLDGHPLFKLTWLGASERSAGKRYPEAAKWHLSAATPGDIASRLVEEAKPGNAPLVLFSAIIIQGSEKFHNMFMVNGAIYVREWKKGLELLIGDSLMLIKGSEKFANERIYSMLPFFTRRKRGHPDRYANDGNV